MMNTNTKKVVSISLVSFWSSLTFLPQLCCFSELESRAAAEEMNEKEGAKKGKNDKMLASEAESGEESGDNEGIYCLPSVSSTL